MTAPNPAQEGRPNGLRAFFAVAGALLVLRVLVGEARVPDGVAPLLNLLSTVAFLAVPIVALFYASLHRWTPRLAAGFLVGGVAVHALSILIARQAMGPGIGRAILESVGQTGLMFWCVGLGALLGTLLKDGNLLLPIALFLAGFDVFLILTPTSLPQQIMQRSPEAFRAVAVQVPGVGIGPLAFVGPADFFFLAMFFVALHRFGMRTGATLKWVVPVLLAYVLVVVYLGHLSWGPIQLGALPALLPIGLTVLLVNARTFRLKADEWAATGVVAAVALGLAWLGYKNAVNARRTPTPPPVSSPSAPAPEAP